jgi:hypothetical protein
VVDDESYFTVEGNEWQLQSYYESENHPATEDVKFIRKNKFPVKVLLWLTVRGISEPVFLKAGLAVKKEVYMQEVSNATGSNWQTVRRLWMNLILWTSAAFFG